MININTKRTLNIILPNTNRALKEVLQSASEPELQKLSQGKDINSLLNSFLKQSAEDPTQDKLLTKLLKENPNLKNLGSVSTNSKELLQTLKQEKSPLPLEKSLTNFLSDIKDVGEKSLQNKIENSGLFLENKLKTIQSPKQELYSLLNDLSKSLQESKLPNVQLLNNQLKELLSSDLFKNISNDVLLKNTQTNKSSLIELSQKVETLLEKFTERLNSSLDKSINPNDILFSKDTKNNLDKISLLNKPEQLMMQTKIKELFAGDFKAVLLQAHEEISNSTSPNKQELLKQIDKLTLQIDYHQLLSHLSNSTSLYIPYSWDALEDGEITIKNQNGEKFFTDIHLQLKEYGELNLRLGLFDKKQLNINISAQSETLKKKMKESLPSLKKQLFDVGIIPKDIRFLDDSPSGYDEESFHSAVGFEVKA